MKNKQFAQWYMKNSLSYLKPEIVQEKNPVDFPLILNIDVTNACNLACKVCPHSFQKMDIGYMDFSLYKDIINECRSYGKLITLNLHLVGEPLLHPKIADMVKYAKETDAAEIVHFNTNAVPLTETMSKNLISSGLDDFTCSVDAATETTFKALKRSSKYTQVEKNIKNFIQIRNKMKYDKPFARVKFMRYHENEHEVPLFVEKWNGIADEVQINEVHDWCGLIKMGGDTPNFKREPCPFLWYSLTVNWNGKVSLCCLDWNCKMVVGDFLKNSLHEIWTGEAMKRIRDIHLSGDLSSLPYCNKCNVLLEHQKRK